VNEGRLLRALTFHGGRRSFATAIV